jgi:maltose O-acetyltransferase
MKDLLKKIYRKIFKEKNQIERLVELGLKLGKNVQIQFDVVIDYSHCFLIDIEDDVVIAPRVHILAHDASSVHKKATRVARVRIGKRSFIGAGSIILPGVTIGENVVIGAGSIVTNDIPSNSIAVGNPARVIGNRIESEKKHLENLDKKITHPVPEWNIHNITHEQKEQMRKELENDFGYLIDK